MFFPVRQRYGDWFFVTVFSWVTFYFFIHVHNDLPLSPDPAYYLHHPKVVEGVESSVLNSSEETSSHQAAHIMAKKSIGVHNKTLKQTMNMLDVPKGNLASSKVDHEEGLGPVSIIIPSFSRMDTLPSILAQILTPETMSHLNSEIVLAHVSQESWDLRAAMHTDANRIIVSQYGGSSYLVTKINHVNYVEDNSKWGCASRYVAALEAQNDVLIHLDDDLLPTDEALAKMIHHVQNEKGFPQHENESNPPRFYGESKRYCGHKGYHRLWSDREEEYENPKDARTFILTNFAAMSSYMNREFVNEFKKNDFYQLAMERFHGNGCDLIFAHYFEKRYVWDEDLHASKANEKFKAEAKSRKFYGGDGHMEVRHGICKCMYSNYTTNCLKSIKV